jgi:hypothetical protein
MLGSIMRLPLLLAAVFLMAAAPRSTPVPLAAQPGTPLDATARQLVAQDLAESRRAGEKPLVLVGSAALGDASDRRALFVQIQSARECGSAGCSTSVFLWRAGTWALVLDGVSGRLAVSANKTRKMADLLTDKDRYVWNGSLYQDSKPAPQVDLRPRPRKH